MHHLFKISFLTVALTSCTVSSPTEDDIKVATNDLFKAFKSTPIESINNLKCNKSDNDSTYNCQYSSTMADGKVLESKGVFSHNKGKWVRTK